MNGETLGHVSRQPSIQMKVYPENVFLWLVHTGQLRADLVQRALREHYEFESQVADGDVVRAVVAFDGDMSLLHYVVNYHPNLHVDELVTAVKLYSPLCRRSRWLRSAILLAGGRCAS